MTAHCRLQLPSLALSLRDNPHVSSTDISAFMLSLLVNFLMPSNNPSVATAPLLFPYSYSSIGKLPSLTFMASLMVLKEASTSPADPGFIASGLENALYRAT